MAYTQEQLDALKAALASGTRRVAYNGREVQYATTEELLQAIRVIEGELGAATGTSSGIRRSFATYSSGYGPRRRGCCW